MIYIVDYELGNLGSIKNMLKWIGIKSEITSDISKLEKADKIILPGVGSFDRAIKNIQKKGIYEVLEKKALKDKIPFLGICLGMQIMTSKSDEGLLKGFNWIEAETVKFNISDKKLKIPHMGWNYVKNYSDADKYFLSNSKFYFIHSYFVKVKNPDFKFLETEYGGIHFDAGFKKENIIGVQFHPEKSHKYGIEFFKNFSQI